MLGENGNEPEMERKRKRKIFPALNGTLAGTENFHSTSQSNRFGQSVRGMADVEGTY